ncbi:unnamed protein product [Gordionus sp. m RMFG-2023]|uniref:protein unc-93 homolog A-like n=1 Tax=Gordionus sp. m RMFG-2023 TaxID=3053472 RepID=UPI0030DEA97A
MADKNMTDPNTKAQKWKYYKNVVALSASFFLLFSAFQAVSTLQTSINAFKGLGSTSLSIIYGFFIISCLFLPELLISFLTIKWTLVLCVLMYTSFIIANFKPAWYTLFPTSALLGLAAGPLWTSQSVYITAMGKKLGQCLSRDKQSSKKRSDTSLLSPTEPSKSMNSSMNSSSNEIVDTVGVGKGTGENNGKAAAIAPFLFGIFFAFFQTGSLLGQLISSLTLKSDFVSAEDHNNSNSNHSFHCGSSFCSNQDSGGSIFKPSQRKIYTLYAVYTALSLSAVLVVSIFLDNLPRQSVKADSYDEDDSNGKGVKKRGSIWSMCFATLNQMRDPRQICLIPLSIYSGLQQGFMSADFTKAYVACYYGVGYLGFVMMVYGAVNAIVCLISGYLNKKISRWPLFLTAAIIHSFLVFPILAFSKQAFATHFYLMFVVAGLWGCFDGIYQPQINGLYSSLFQNNPEPAFANHRLWESLGFIISFGYHDALCIKFKLIFMSVMLVLATISYIVLETRVKNRVS